MKRILYVVSNINKAKAFEWISDYFREDDLVDISFCFLIANASETAEYLASQNIRVSTISVRGKRDWPLAFIRILRILGRIKPDVVHCHLLSASVLGLCAAYVSQVKCRILTRHHGSMHHISFPKGLFWDILCNKLATKIISISPATNTILLEWEGVRNDKVVFIPHGFPRSSCRESNQARKEAFMVCHGIPRANVVIGVVSRFEDWKGVQYTIDAFKSLVKERPDCHLLLMNARGSYAQVIQNLLSDLPSSHYTIVSHDPDMSSAYAAMDLFVHVPVDPYVEAFGQVYIEAMAASVPMICTLSGIAPSIVKSGDNALVVPFCDSGAIKAAMLELIDNPAIAVRLAARALSAIENNFSLETMCQRLRRLYAGDISV
jgi:glycosyltransferase involved in cell wall biosynthesis